MIVGKENNSILITQGLYTLNLHVSVCLSVCLLYNYLFLSTRFFFSECISSLSDREAHDSRTLGYQVSSMLFMLPFRKGVGKNSTHAVSLFWVARWYLIVNRSSMAADTSMLQKWAHAYVFYHYSLFSSILPNNSPPMLFIFLLYWWKLRWQAPLLWILSLLVHTTQTSGK